MLEMDQAAGSTPLTSRFCLLPSLPILPSPLPVSSLWSQIPSLDFPSFSFTVSAHLCYLLTPGFIFAFWLLRCLLELGGIKEGLQERRNE